MYRTICFDHLIKAYIISQWFFHKTNNGSLNLQNYGESYTLHVFTCTLRRWYTTYALTYVWAELQIDRVWVQDEENNSTIQEVCLEAKNELSRRRRGSSSTDGSPQEATVQAHAHGRIRQCAWYRDHTCLGYPVHKGCLYGAVWIFPRNPNSPLLNR